MLSVFNAEVVTYLTRSSCELCDKLLHLVKFRESGDFDFSFPISMRIWKNYLKDFCDDYSGDNIMLYAQGSSSDDFIENFRTASVTWTFQIDEIQIKDNRCNFTINRPVSYLKVVEELSKNNCYGHCGKEETETMSLETDGDDNSSISELRVELVSKIVTNLLPYSKFIQVNDPSIAKHKILVTTKSNLNKNHSQSNRKLLTCGVVTNPLDKKLSEVHAHDYIEKRCEDMHLTSIHRYGVRAKNDEAFKKLIEQLGRNAVTLDLMEVKPSSAVMLTANANQAFILYNSARLETLMGKFQVKVEEGYYETLPDVAKVDFSLLKEEEEWELLKLLLTFPEVIQRSIHELSEGKVAIHLIHKYLSDLVNTFSVYYRRVRLLTENRAQLIPVLHAKIHFLRAVQRIFNETLAIFCIEPIAFM